MPGVSRILISLMMLGGLAAIGVVLVSGPALFDRLGAVKRHFFHRTDGVGQGIHYAICDLASPSQAGSTEVQCAPANSNTSMLGEHVLLWHEDRSSPTIAVTPAIDTQSRGSSLLAFSAGYSSNHVAPTDNKGNPWTLLGETVAYRGYQGEFNVKAYVSLAANGGIGHVVSIIKNSVPSGEITVPFIEVKQAGVLQAVAQNYPDAAPVITSDSVTTTGPATLVAFWWGDARGLQHSAIPDNGFSTIEKFVTLPPKSAVQSVVAVRHVTSAGTYDVSWTQSPSQGAVLWLLAFQTTNLDLVSELN